MFTAGVRRAFVTFLALSIVVGPGGLNAYAATIPPIVLPPARVVIADVAHCAPCVISDGVNSVISAISMFFKKGSPGIAGMPIYNSANLAPSPWGIGWISDIDHYAVLDATGSVTIVDDSGTRLTFARNGSSNGVPVYRSPVGTHLSLTASLGANSAVNSLTERDNSGASLLFATPTPASVGGNSLVPGAVSALRMTRLTDRNGNTVDYQRDSQGRLTKVKDIHGRYFTITYNAAGYVATLSDSGGRTVSFDYDAQGRKTGEAGPEGSVSYQYDAASRLTRITFPNAGVRNFTYDGGGKLTGQDDGDGVNAVTYSRYASSTVIADALGKQTVYEYAKNQGFTTISKVKDATGHQVSFTYDSDLNLTGSTDELGRSSSYIYDSRGNVVSITDPAGNISRASYETTFNRPLTLTNPLNRTASFSYDTKGDLIQLKDPRNNVLELSYDAFGHMTSAKNPLGGTTGVAYDVNGAPVSVTDELGRSTVMQRDALSRLTGLTDPRGHKTAFSYDAAGNVLQLKNALNGVTNIAYTPGRDGGRLPTSITDAMGHATTLVYDAHGRVTSVSNALGQTTSVAYNAVGAPISAQTRNGNTVSIAYDDLHRVTGLTLPEGGVSLGYNAVGSLTAASHYNGTALGVTYDSLNRPTQVVQTLPNGFTYTVGYTYDANGNCTVMTTPQGTFRYSYDALDRVTAIINPYGQAVTFTYDALSRRKTMTYPNGTVTNYRYDAAGRVTQLAHKRAADQTTIASDVYAYDANDNATSITDAEGVHTYAYDELNRLTSATHPAGTSLPVHNETFTYDAVGNRLSDAQRTDYTYDAANRLVSDSSFTYTYDADGNMTSRSELASGTTTTFVYNSSDQLVRVEASTYTIAAYKYDMAGKRVEKSVGGVVTRYVYDGPNILAVLDASNNLLQLMTQGPGVDAPLIAHSGTSDYFFHADALGSVTTLTDSSGQKVESVEYQAYGKGVVKDAGGQMHAASTVGNVFLFAARELDAETGLYYNRARYLDEEAGRFLREDPIARINFYQYANNNPVKFRDPFGANAVESVIYTASDFFAGFGYGYSWGQLDAQGFYDSSSNGYRIGKYVGGGLFAATAGIVFAPVVEAGLVSIGILGAGTVLYRAVGPEELTEINSTGRFSVGPNGFPGKFFAETFEDAVIWGRNLGNSKIIRATFPGNSADKLMRWSRLDGIGPARYGTVEEVNACAPKIREVTR